MAAIAARILRVDTAGDRELRTGAAGGAGRPWSRRTPSPSAPPACRRIRPPGRCRQFRRSSTQRPGRSRRSRRAAAWRRSPARPAACTSCAASTFKPRTSRPLPPILACPNAAPCFCLPVHPPLHRVDIHEGQYVRAGQQRCSAGQLRQEPPADLLQLPHVPQVNAAGTTPASTVRAYRRTAPASRRGAASPCHRCCPRRRSSRPPGTRSSPGVHAHGRAIRTCSAASTPRPPARQAITGPAQHATPVRVIKPRVDLRQLMQQSHFEVSSPARRR